MVAITDPIASIERFAYGPTGHLIEHVDADGVITRWRWDTAGNLIEEIDGLGNRWRYEHDVLGRPVALSDPLERTHRVDFDPLGRPVTATDPSGAKTETRYDRAGRRVRTVGPDGSVTRWKYDGFGELAEVTDPVGGQTRFIRDTTGRVAVMTRPDGAKLSWQRDSAGRVIAETDSLGRTTRTERDLLGRATSIVAPGPRTTQFEYDPVGNLARSEMPDGAVVERSWDLMGRLQSVRDPDGVAVAIEYDAIGRPVRATGPGSRQRVASFTDAGRLASVTGERGDVTTHDYDRAGQLIASTDALGRKTSLERDAAGAITAVERSGIRQTFAHDERGLVTEITDATGVVRHIRYDSAGRLAATWTGDGGPDEQATVRSYDPAGRLVALTDPLGATWQFAYDALGRRTGITDPLGRTTRASWDAAGRPIERIDPRGATWQWAYDTLDGWVERTDPLGRTTRWERDTRGRVVGVRRPDGTETQSQWSPAGRILSYIDPSGATWRTNYDSAGDPVSRIDPLGREVRVERDGAGDVVRRIGPDGSILSWDRDALGRVTDARAADGSHRQWIFGPSDDLVTAIDGDGETRFGHDAEGRLTEIARAGRPTLTREYDVRGRLVVQRIADTEARFDWDAANRVTSVSIGDDTLRFERDALGRIVGQVFGQAEIRREYDEAGRVVRITGGGLESTRTLDPVGNVRELVRAPGQTTAFTYDALDRLIAITEADGSTRSFTLDALGQRTRESRDSAVVARFTYDAAHQLTTVEQNGRRADVRHDGDGRVVVLPGPDGREWLLDWDGFGSLVRAVSRDSQGSGADDPLDDPPVPPVAEATWVRDAMGALLGHDDTALLEDASGLSAMHAGDRSTRWIPGEGLDRRWLRIADADGPSPTLAVPVQDPVGTVLGHVASTGEAKISSWEPFGDSPAGDRADLGFAGRPRCPKTGVVDMRARPYAPWLGRFLAPDPIGIEDAGPVDQGRYGFAGGNPLRFADPRGLNSSDIDGGFYAGDYDGGSWDTYSAPDYDFDPYDYDYEPPDPSDIVADLNLSRPYSDTVGVNDLPDWDFSLDIDVEGMVEDAVAGVADMDTEGFVRDTSSAIREGLGDGLLGWAASKVFDTVAGVTTGLASLVSEPVLQVGDMVGLGVELLYPSYQHRIMSGMAQSAADNRLGTGGILVGGAVSTVTMPFEFGGALLTGDMYAASRTGTQILAGSRWARNRSISGLGKLGGWGQSAQRWIRERQIAWMTPAIAREFQRNGWHVAPKIQYGGVKKGTRGSYSWNDRTKPGQGTVTLYEGAFVGSAFLRVLNASKRSPYNIRGPLGMRTLLYGVDARTTLRHELWHGHQHKTHTAWYQLNSRLQSSFPKKTAAWRDFYRNQNQIEFTHSPLQPLPGAHNQALAMTGWSTRLAPFAGLGTAMTIMTYGDASAGAPAEIIVFVTGLGPRTEAVNAFKEFGDELLGLGH